MTIDTASPRTRRALLTAAIGGAAAAATATVARADPVQAADSVFLGIVNESTARTTVRRTTSGQALRGETGDGTGLFGSATGGVGSLGVGGSSSSGTGVIGGTHSGTGVKAFSDIGHGLHVEKGRIKVDQVSGVATIKRGRKSVVVTPGVDINANTFVLLTPRANIGSRALWYTTNPIPINRPSGVCQPQPPIPVRSRVSVDGPRAAR